MSTDDRDRRIRELWGKGDFVAAAKLWLEVLGPEIASFLASMPTPAIDSSELFSQFCEDLWRSLPTLRWECSARTWSYLLARNVWHRAFKRSRRRGPHLPLSEVPELFDAVE